MATSGPLYPGTTANLSNAGTSESAEAWVNPGNVASDNATEATITAATYDSPDISQILVCSNFGFTIPAGSTIQGITVEIDRRSIIASSGKDFRVQLAKGTTFADLVGSNLAVPATIWPSTTAVATYGGAANLWGTTWTDAEINASSFAVFLSAQANIANADVGVDFVRVTVTYAPIVGGTLSVTGTATVARNGTVTYAGALAVAGAGTIGLDGTVTPAGGGGLTTYVDDDFEARSPLTDTWGSAPTGGDYTGDGTATDIASGRGTMTHAAATNTVARLLSSTAAQDVELTAVVQTDKVPTGAEVQIRCGLRMVDTSNYYRIGVYPQITGDVVIEAHSFVAGVAGTNVFSITHPTLAWAAGTDYSIKVQVEGVSPTTIRVKIWPTSGSEPGSWDATGTDSAAALQTSGFYGIIFRTTSSVTNFPIAASWAWWKVTSIPTGGGTQAGTLSVTGTGALAQPGTETYAGALSVTGTANVIRNGTITAAGALAVAGAGAIAFAPSLTLGTTWTQAGAGTLALSSAVLHPTTLSPNGAGTLAQGPTMSLAGSLSVTGAGSFAALGGSSLAGTLALTGTGSLGLTPLVTRNTTLAVTGTGALAASGIETFGGTLAPTGTGALGLAFTGTIVGTLSLTGTGALSQAGAKTAGASASLTGTGALGASGGVITPGTFAPSGTGSFAPSLTGTLAGSLAVTGVGSLGLTGTVTGNAPTLSLTGTGALAQSGRLTLSTSFAPTGVGTAVFGGVLTERTTLAPTGAGTVAFTGSMKWGSTLTPSGTGSFGLGGSMVRGDTFGPAGAGTIAWDGTTGLIFEALDPGATGSVTLGGLSGTVRLVSASARVDDVHGAVVSGGPKGPVKVVR